MSDAASDPEPVFRLIYHSHSRIPAAESTAELGAIFTSARRNNKRRGSPARS